MDFLHVQSVIVTLLTLKKRHLKISFYKIFGYPTGIGALLVKCSALDMLTKKYFGGGTVDMNLVNQKIHVPKSSSAEGISIFMMNCDLSFQIIEVAIN